VVRRRRRRSIQRSANTSEVVSVKNLTPLLAICLFSLAGCRPLAHDETLIGPYHLRAEQTDEQMHLCYVLPNGDSVGRIEPYVFAVGWDEHYIVAKQLPSRGITNFFILNISLDGPLVDPSVSLTGPLTGHAFKAKSSELHLPPFTRVVGPNM
jgi:hypothetical protein